MKNFKSAAILLVAGIALVGLVLVLIQWLIPSFFTAAIEVPWVAGGVILAGFLVAVLWKGDPGWNPRGVITLLIAVAAGASIDIAGNPVMYAPIEALFLEPGQVLQTQQHIEAIGGEVHSTASYAIVDSAGTVVGTANGLLIALYRALVYFIFYSVLLTALGALARVWKRRPTPEGTAAA